MAWSFFLSMYLWSDGECADVGLSGGVGAVVPLVAPGVGQGQATPDEFKPHAAGGARTGRGGMVGVAADEADGLGVAAERDVDEAGARGGGRRA